MNDKSMSSYDHLEDIEIAPFENEKVFIPTRQNKPPDLKPILTINNVQILTHQNITVIIAAPGSGKSSVCEAICSSAINRDCDSLGIKVSDEVKNVLFIDTERVNTDVWNSFDRMNRRAGTIDSDKAQIVGLRSVPCLKERKKVIEDLIKHHKPQLIILDGAGDMVTDTNNLEKVIEMRIWFRELTAKYKLSILTTLHPNKSSKNPRGHIGSDLLREGEGVFIIEKNGAIHTLTDSFDHGKNRNAQKTETSFTWCNEKNMFISCDAPIDLYKKEAPQVEINEDEITKYIHEICGEGIGAGEFKSKLTQKIKEHHPLAKTSGRSINDYYLWLQKHKFIIVSGTSAKKIIQAHPDLDKNQIKLEL